MELTDLKAPEPVLGIPPWRDPRWLAEAEGWIDAACARAGLARTGPALARARPYSVVALVPTDDGTVWFKASPPASSFEPPRLAALPAWRPDRFTAPIAVDLDRAWSLTRDGGPTLRDQHAQTHDGSGAWPTTLRGYARLQLGLARHADDMLALGVPDLRPGSVTARFEKLLDDPATEQVIARGAITRDQHDALRALAPRLREWCAELADLAIPASLDHADVHPHNIFAATETPFDWGDAAVAHPFSSLLVPLRITTDIADPALQSAERAVLTENYVGPWLEAGHPRAAIDRSLSLALRIAPLTRALAWGRLFPCYLGHPEPATHAAHVLTTMLTHNPLAPFD